MVKLNVRQQKLSQAIYKIVNIVSVFKMSSLIFPFLVCPVQRPNLLRKITSPFQKKQHLNQRKSLQQQCFKRDCFKALIFPTGWVFGTLNWGASSLRGLILQGIWIAAGRGYFAFELWYLFNKKEVSIIIIYIGTLVTDSYY